MLSFKYYPYKEQINLALILIDHRRFNILEHGHETSFTLSIYSSHLLSFLWYQECHHEFPCCKTFKLFLQYSPSPQPMKKTL